MSATRPTTHQPGYRYEQWTLLRHLPSTYADGKRTRRAYWEALCACGSVGQLNAEKVLSGEARTSCGCKPKRVKPKERPARDASKAVNSVFQWAAR